MFNRLSRGSSANSFIAGSLTKYLSSTVRCWTRLCFISVLSADLRHLLAALLWPHMTADLWHCKKYTTHMHNSHYTLNTAYCNLKTAHYTLNTAYCNFKTAHYTLNTAYCNFKTAHYTLNTAYCTLHT